MKKLTTKHYFVFVKLSKYRKLFLLLPSFECKFCFILNSPPDLLSFFFLSLFLSHLLSVLRLSKLYIPPVSALISCLIVLFTLRKKVGGLNKYHCRLINVSSILFKMSDWNCRLEISFIL